MTINDRIEKIITELFDGRQTAFASAIDIAPSVVNSIIGKRQSKPSFEVLEKISKIEEINPEWLLKGKGNMLINYANAYNSQSSENNIIYNAQKPIIRKPSLKPPVETRPRIPYDAAAGFLASGMNGVTAAECEQIPVITSFPDYDFTILARGESMVPDFMSGDELACAFVKERNFIQWGRPHILDTAQGVVLKKIYPKPDAVLCHSSNPDYPDFEVPKSDIFNMALVVGLIRHY